MTTTKLIVGILGAAAAGVIIGVLIAPEKGADLRSNLKKTAEDWADEISDWMGKGKEYLSEMKNRVASEADELKDEAEQAGNGLKSTITRKRSGYQS
jgi:gas vesicle protein